VVIKNVANEGEALMEVCCLIKSFCNLHVTLSREKRSNIDSLLTPTHHERCCNVKGSIQH